MGKDFYTKKICGIYLITNTKNGMKYCGQSIDITQRWKSHTTPNKSVIGAAIAKDLQSFTFKILEECPREMLNEREKYYIELYVCLHPYGYNMTSGGSSGCVVSDATKKKLSLKKIGNQIAKGHIHTAETKAKMSADRMGNKYSLGYSPPEEVREKIRVANLGKKLTPEQCMKVSIAKKAYWEKKRLDKTNNIEKELN